MAEKPKLWERQPYDTKASFAYFQLYLEQDPPRSLIEAYRIWRRQRGAKEARRLPGSWLNLAQGRTRRGEPIEGALSWELRALAFDDYVAALEREKWVKRRLDLREKEWAAGEGLLDKVEQMLMFPVVAQSIEGGQTIIMPADWKFRDIPAILTAASKTAACG